VNINMHNCVSLVNGEMLHSHYIRCFICSIRKLYICGLGSRVTFTIATLTSFSRPMHSVAPPAVLPTEQIAARWLQAACLLNTQHVGGCRQPAALSNRNPRWFLNPEMTKLENGHKTAIRSRACEQATGFGASGHLCGL